MNALLVSRQDSLDTLLCSGYTVRGGTVPPAENMDSSENICLDLCKQIVEALRMPVLVLGRDQCVLYANHASKELADKEVVGTHFEDLVGRLGLESIGAESLLPAEWWTDDASSSTWQDVDDIPHVAGRAVSRIRRRLVLGEGDDRYALLTIELATPWEQRYLDTVKSQDGLAHALVAAEERFNVLFRESSDPVLILGPEGEILSANAGFERYTGLSAEHWFHDHQGWSECVHPDDVPMLKDAFARCVSGGEGALVELRLLNGEGFYQWFELSLSPLHDEAGNVPGMVVVARNINRRKELEFQLREKAQSMQKRHQRAQLLIAKLKHFFSRISSLPSDIDGYLSGVCAALNDMYRPHAVSVHVVYGEEKMYVEGGAALQKDAFRVPETLSQAVQESGLPLYCNTLNLTDPYRNDRLVREVGYITFLGAPLRDSTGRVRGILSILDRDKQYFDNVDVELITVAALHIAARLRAEEQEVVNRELADHLRQAQKMEAVGMLAGGIAHDFNNILSGILGFSSYLLSKVDESSTVHRDLKLIEQSAVRASELTRQLLAFARRKHFAKEAVSMNTVIGEVLGLIRRSIPKHIAVEDSLEEDLPLILGDPGQLNQVVMNLCLNASDAMRDQEEGRLRVSTEHRSLTPRERIILAEDTDDEFVCVSVSDTGIGMSEELQEHIYEPFYTTKSDAGGTGLGLSIVYGIISNHGGHIIVDSEEGHGADFTMYLPVYQGRARDEADGDVEVLTGNETVLVIDDEPIVRQMVTEVLKGNGYKVIAAESGMEAVHYLDELRGRVDLVLLDMIMPEMDGEATFKALRRIDPDIPILLTSGYVQEDKGERLIKAGALGMVYKPYKSDVLLRRVRHALNGRPSPAK